MLLYQDHKSVVYALAFSPDGSTLASAHQDGSVFLREAFGDRHPLLETDPQRRSINSIAYSPDGATIFLGASFGWLGMKRENGCWRVFGRLEVPVTSLAMLDERTLAVGIGDRVKGEKGKFELWDVATGKKRDLLRGQDYFFEPNGVRVVATCPEKKIVAYATGHREVCVWDSIRGEKPVRIGLQKACLSVALSPDGQQMAAAVDYGVKVYSIKNPRRERIELKGHKGQVSTVAFSPDGSTIATGSWDTTVKLWDAATGRERATFSWSIGRVYCLTYAPDGLRLAAGDDLGAIVVWDME